MAHVAPAERSVSGWRSPSRESYYYGADPGQYEAGMIGRVTVR